MPDRAELARGSGKQSLLEWPAEGDEGSPGVCESPHPALGHLLPRGGRRADPAIVEPGLVHGGDLDAARLRFPDAPLPWVDLSTGINPHAYSMEAVPADAWRRLPEPAALAGLEARAATAYACAPGASVVAAPGTQVLIQLLPRLLPARRVAVLGFGYEEHPAVWRHAGADVAIVDRLADLHGADVAVVVNPNNPDGRRVAPEDLVALTAALAAEGGTLVVDEAFADVAASPLSLVPTLPARGAIVLRSFGKMYGLAGLRLGFAVTHAGLAGALRAALGPWAVSGPALAIGTVALSDAGWRQAMLARLAEEAAKLDRLLASAHLPVIGGTSLFRLVESPEAVRCFERLGRAGILVRAFPARPEWLRFGLPADEPAWDRLSMALQRPPANGD